MERRLRIRHFNLGSCNGCDIELLAALKQDPSLQLVTEIDQADVLLVTGAMTPGNAARVDAAVFSRGLPTVLLGACAATQGIFAPAAGTLPTCLKPGYEGSTVSGYGCPPPPASLLSALRALIDKEESDHGNA